AVSASSRLSGVWSVGVSVVLFIVYAANLVYTLITHRDVFAFDEDAHATSSWALWKSLAVLVGATAATALMAELVSGALAATADALGVSTFFLGVVVLAIIGNAA